MYQAGDKEVIQCNIRDITERKQAEDEIRRLNGTGAACRRTHGPIANRQRGTGSVQLFRLPRFARAAAPYRGLRGTAATRCRTVTFEKSLRHLTTISESAKRMGDLIDDLLAFSRIGRAEMQKTEFNLDELVQETLGDFQAETKERNIAWKIHPLPPVRADRLLLRWCWSI